MIASAEFSIPKSILKQAMRLQQEHSLGASADLARFEESFESDYKDKIARWVGGGYLIDQGDHYLFRFELMNGRLKINGTVTDF